MDLDFQLFSPTIKGVDGLNLPYEVVLHIFSFLEFSDILRLKIVCKRFHKITSEYSLYRLFVIKLQTTGSKISPRVCHSAVVHKNSMFVYGGHLPDCHTFIKDVKNDIYSYNFETRKWLKIETNGKPLPNKTEHSAVVYKGSMYIFGGYSGKEQSYLDVSIYKLNLDTMTGETIEGTGEKPAGRSAHIAAVWNDYMYIFGGWDGNDTNNEFYRFHFPSAVWERVRGKGPLPPQIRSHSATVYKDYLYIIGGYGPNGHTEFPYSYNLLENEWVPLIDNRDGPCSRSRLRTVAYGDALWCLGGWNRTSYYNDLWRFSLESRTWKKIQSRFDLKGIGQHSLVTYKNQMYIYGGYNPSTSSPQGELYTYMVGIPDEEIMNLEKISEDSAEELSLTRSSMKSLNVSEDQSLSKIGIPTN
eukprot:gene610-758_t